ncbi:MAG: D-tyrosyl-tRNA(Tyr) deacylase [Clostridiales bacterium]|nr:D-tyrosyl-tRNA(Tyr) deacylase [Clostridiales bacterium]
MKAVIQRVDGATLSVGGEVVSSIGRGLVVYVGIEQADVEANIVAFAQKLVAMRIFPDGDGKLNLSVRDVGGSILLVSNFTLCADISHGNRPSFTNAMRPAVQASSFFDYCVNVVTDCMRGSAGSVESGVFGADMIIDQVNDGPITIIYG